MLIFDIETDGLLPHQAGKDKTVVSKIHLVVTYNTGSGKLNVYRQSGGENSIQEGLLSLQESPAIAGHNIIGYDLPVIKHLYPGWEYSGEVVDTLTLSSLIWSDLKNTDYNKRDAGRLPEGFKMYGSHALKAWGQRLGMVKGDFGEQTDWQKWSQEMEDYCIRDVELNARLWKLIDSKGYDERAVKLEHQFSTIIRRQETRGFTFDVKEARELYALLSQKRAEAGEVLTAAIKPWYTGKIFTPKRDNKTLGYRKGCSMSKLKLIEFNPASGDHIANRLIKLYGWKPKVMTPSGKPKTDEAVLSKLQYPIIPDLMRWIMLDKRIGQLAEGKAAWLKLEQDGVIHGSVKTNGAVTGRCTHSHPNIANVTASGKPYGSECRSLFIPRAGYTLLGCDASGLELRCLAHYMGDADYTAAVVDPDGDIHTKNQMAAGLPTRDAAKTFIYAFNYGAGDAKLGSILGKGAKAGKALRDKFLRSLPALDRLIQGVKKAAERGYLKGLDGRVLPVRSPHAALNTLLQGAGAVAMKQALVCLDADLQESGLRPGREYEFVANVHDEFQIEVMSHLAKGIGRIAVRAIEQAGEILRFKCPLTGEFKIGNSWAETH